MGGQRRLLHVLSPPPHQEAPRGNRSFGVGSAAQSSEALPPHTRPRPSQVPGRPVGGQVAALARVTTDTARAASRRGPGPAKASEEALKC